MRPRGVDAAAFFAAVWLAACAPAAPTVTVDGRSFAVEVRDTQAGREEGLSGRAEVPPGTGMLFTYDGSGIRSYWMSGMLVSIDLAWIDDGRVLGVITMDPCEGACPTYTSPAPADAVLEVGQGALAGVEPGDRVLIER